MNLLIAEKPDVGKNKYGPLLELVEGEKFVQKEGYLQGKKWIVSWCIGHLVTLAEPETYGYSKNWKLEELPMLPDKWKFTVMAKTAKQYKVLKGLVQQADMIINGTDAGREGELIYRLVVNLAGAQNKPQKRLWLSSYVMKDMQKAWSTMKDSKFYDHLYDAAAARQQGDWLIGMNATRGYSIKTQSFCSVGRVQTPTLALIVSRDQQVETAKTIFYFQLKALWQDIELFYIQDNQTTFEAPEQLNTILNQCIGKTGMLEKIEKTKKQANPAKPFDLSNLQKEANKKFRYKAADTLKFAQQLYEAKYITYPRTDSEYLPESMLDEAYSRMLKLLPPGKENRVKPKDDKFSFFNSSKVTDHFAIIPTDEQPGDLSGPTLNIYSLILERFVNAFGKPHIYFQIKPYVLVQQTQYYFTATLKEIIDPGYRDIFSTRPDDAESGENSVLQEINSESLREGAVNPMKDLQVLKKERSKPKYYTEATLLTAMETAGKTITDEALKEAMKERGLGTPATKSGIIEILKKREYIISKGNSLVSTTKGRELIRIVDETLKSAELTGEWEYKLRQMEKGNYQKSVFQQEIRNYLNSLTQEFHIIDDEFAGKVQGEVHKCPKCKSDIRINKGGAFCSNNSNGCDFKIWRKIAGKNITDDALNQLLKAGITKKLKGFTSSKGKKFEARLKVENNTVTFQF